MKWAAKENVRERERDRERERETEREREREKECESESRSERECACVMCEMDLEGPETQLVPTSATEAGGLTICQVQRKLALCHHRRLFDLLEPLQQRVKKMRSAEGREDQSPTPNLQPPNRDLFAEEIPSLGAPSSA